MPHGSRGAAPSGTCEVVPAPPVAPGAQVCPASSTSVVLRGAGPKPLRGGKTIRNNLQKVGDAHSIGSALRMPYNFSGRRTRLPNKHSFAYWDVTLMKTPRVG